MRELNPQQIEMVSGGGIGESLAKLGGKLAGGGVSVAVNGFLAGREIGKAAVKKIRSALSD